MKNTVILIVIALVSLNPTPEACHGQLTHETGSEVAFDGVTGRYWYYDITRFSDMTYDEQTDEIEAISVEGFSGNWHMATYEEMAELWDNTAEAIFFGFAPTRGDHEGQLAYTLGRYDENAGEGSHYFAYVGTTADEGYEKSVLNYLDMTRDGDHYELLGAWVVYEGEPPVRAASIRSSFLGNWGRPYPLDKDMFTLNGTEGEIITLRLEPDPAGSHPGGLATLILKDKIHQLRFLRVAHSVLPHEITATLPKTGQYQIWVQEQHWPGRGESFSGRYRLTLESSQDAWETLQSSPWVE